MSPVWRAEEIRGYVHPDFEAVAHALALCVPPVGPGGTSVSVYHRGELVVNASMGTVDVSGRPFLPETLAMCLSTSKGVLATLLHVMVDRGLVDLDARVADYWPEFGCRGKERTTVRQVAAHQSGLYPIAPLLRSPEQIFDWDAMVAALADATPAHEPGTNFGYHAWTFGWVLGEVMQRATGKRFPDLLRELLAEPLGLTGLYIGLPESELGRRAPLVVPETPPLPPRGLQRVGVRFLDRVVNATGINTNVRESISALVPPGFSSLDLNDPRFATAVIPSVNGTFDAASLARLYAPLALGGSLDGVHLVAPEILAQATADQNGAVCRVIPFPLRVKLGYHRPISLGLRLRVFGHAVDLGVPSPDAFGHFGFGGSGAWADPERALSVGLVTNCFFGTLPLDLRTVAICTAAAHAADARR